MNVLFVGESWTSYSVEIKGFNIYTTGSYEEGGGPLLEVFKHKKIDYDYIKSHEVAKKFPDEINVLNKYDVVIFSDVGSDTFLLHPETINESKVRTNRLNLVAEYVEKGGAFLMIGGYLSFSGFEGKANYINTIIQDVLPVKLLGRDDRIEKPEGCIPVIEQEHEIIDGINKWPKLLGYNRLIAKDDSEVLLSVGEDPFLVIGRYGKGRAAAFASDCSPHWGSPEFVNWDHYEKIWYNLLSWLEKS